MPFWSFQEWGTKQDLCLVYKPSTFEMVNALFPDSEGAQEEDGQENIMN